MQLRLMEEVALYVRSLEEQEVLEHCRQPALFISHWQPNLPGVTHINAEALLRIVVTGVILQVPPPEAVCKTCT
jgi:hypothetical protein